MSHSMTADKIQTAALFTQIPLKEGRKQPEDKSRSAALSFTDLSRAAE